MTARELRAQLWAQQQRNTPATAPASELRSPQLSEWAAANDTDARQWRIAYLNLPVMTVLFTPAATRAEVADLYAGASIEPMPDALTRTATPAEAAELRVLITAILADDSEAYRAEALAVALADPDAALASLRTLAAGGRPIPWRTKAETVGDPSRP